MEKSQDFINRQDEGIDDDIDSDEDDSDDDDDDSDDFDEDDDKMSIKTETFPKLLCQTCGEVVDDDYLKVEGKLFCSEECLEREPLFHKQISKVFILESALVVYRVSLE